MTGRPPLREAVGGDLCLPIFTSTGISSGSGLPLVCVVNEFLGGDIFGGLSETETGSFPLDLGAQLGGNAVQARGGNLLQVAFGDFLFDLFEVSGEDLPALMALAEDALREGLGFGRAKVLDVKLMLAAPLDERGFGDIQFGGDLIEAPALRTQEDEAGDGFRVRHSLGSVNA